MDIDLNLMIDNHNLNGGSVTMLLKEVDFTSKQKVPLAKGETENYDIFGICDWVDSNRYNSEKYHRIVFKSNSFESQNMAL